MLLQDELLQEGQHINRLEMLFHSLNDFGDGHPIVDFTGEPRVILGVPHIVRWSPPSDYLQSFLVGNQHGDAILGHLVLGPYPGHRLGFRGNVINIIYFKRTSQEHRKSVYLIIGHIFHLTQIQYNSFCCAYKL